MNIGVYRLGGRTRSTAATAISCLLLAGCAHPEKEVRGAPLEDVCIVDGALYPTDEIGLGCASAANLDLMLAYPEHVESPVELAPPEGNAATAPARRYQLDQVESLPSGPSPEPEDQ